MMVVNTAGQGRDEEPDDTTYDEADVRASHQQPDDDMG